MDVIEDRYISNPQGDWRIRLVPDPDSTPSDCYSDADVSAYRRGEWRFVGVVVSDEATGMSESVWSVEYGQFADVDPIGMDQIIMDQFDHLKDEIISRLVERVKSLIIAQ